MAYIALFLSFVQIGLFSIGGGYAALPLIQHQVVEVHSWLTITEFADIITIAEVTPGPIALNAATFVGTKISGVLGALVATAGCILPSCIIVLVLAWVYCRCRNMDTLQNVLRCMRPAVVAMIASSGLSILIFSAFDGKSFNINNINLISIAIFVIGYFLLRKYRLNPIAVILSAGFVGIFIYSII